MKVDFVEVAIITFLKRIVEWKTWGISIPKPPLSNRYARHSIHVFLLSFVPTLFLIFTLFLLSSCNREQIIEDPYARYRPAMREEYQDDFEGLETAPRYDLDITLDPEEDLLRGTATIVIHNTSPDPWDHLIFRLYPALKQYGGKMTIQSVTVGDRPTSFVYQTGNTALYVSLPEPLFTNRSVTVYMSWKLEFPTWPDASGVYALFGQSQQMLSLPLFYPSLAVYEPGPTVGTGRWWKETGIVRGDAAFNVTSLFVVTATLPTEQVPVASGTLITSTLAEEGQTRYIWATGPSREFLLHMSPLFSSDHAEAYGTTVTSYWLPGEEASGRAALGHAVAALRIYTDLFGPYPFRDMRVAPAPLSFRGMEYPQVSLLGVEVYSRFRNSLESLVVHEVAHHWWYQLVHNDPVNSPWLDEALAEYAIKLYIEALYGTPSAQSMQQRRWQKRVDGVQNAQIPIDSSVASFASGPLYEAIVYSKGALFYDEARQIMGDRQFIRFLQFYLESYQYQIVDTSDWVEAIQTLKNPELEALYTEWVQDSPLEQKVLEQIQVESD